MRNSLIFTLLALGTTSAFAQFTNGNFETGDFTGWTIAPTSLGTTAIQQVVSFDIDGPGALTSSLSGQFSVGRQTGVTTGSHGITITQMLNLTANTAYTFDFDWAATRTTASSNAEGGVFSLIVNGVAIATQSAGATSSSNPHFGHITAGFTPTASGAFSVGAMITRPFTVPSPTTLLQNVDNFTMSPAVPEPATMAALGLGVAALLRRRRK